MSRMLVAYYSWSNGNTKKIAEELASAKNADLVRIETAEPYTGSYEEVVEQGKQEVERKFKPRLKPLEKDLSQFDVIAVGTPTWWYTMAPAVRTFLEENDFSGKTVIPFMTNGGWPGNVIQDMTAAAKGAEIKHSMEIQFDSQGGAEQVTPQEDVEQWIRNIE